MRIHKDTSDKAYEERKIKDFEIKLREKLERQSKDFSFDDFSD